ncbi:MAG: LysR family transcriptional regulator [Planctomycetota bacterium]
MRLFADVARCRSLSEAAALHGITQSAASQRIQSLEKHLGVRLLDRSVRPISLTPAGKVYFRGCQELVARSEAIEQEVRLVDHELSGVIRVFGMYSTGIGWMREVQSRFMARCPDAEVQVHYDRPDVIHEAVLDGRCDLGLVSFPEEWPSVDFRPLRDESMALVCPTDHPLAQEPEPIDLAALTDVRMAVIAPDLPMGRHTLDAIKRAGGEPILIDHFDNIDTLKVVAIEANCVAILPTRTVRREVSAGVLKTMAIAPKLIRPFGMIYDKARGLNPVATAFAEEMARYRDSADPPENLRGPEVGEDPAPAALSTSLPAF